jgi:hypothetical protein
MPEERKLEEQSLSELEKPKASWIWLKDSAGYPSITVTFVTVAFWVTTLAYILSLVAKVGSVEFRPFDVGACGGYLTPLLALYFSRRWTDAKYGAAK